MSTTGLLTPTVSLGVSLNIPKLRSLAIPVLDPPMMRAAAIICLRPPLGAYPGDASYLLPSHRSGMGIYPLVSVVD